MICDSDCRMRMCWRRFRADCSNKIDILSVGSVYSYVLYYDAMEIVKNEKNKQALVMKKL